MGNFLECVSSLRGSQRNKLQLLQHLASFVTGLGDSFVIIKLHYQSLSNALVCGMNSKATAQGPPPPGVPCVHQRGTGRSLVALVDSFAFLLHFYFLTSHRAPTNVPGPMTSVGRDFSGFLWLSTSLGSS